MQRIRTGSNTTSTITGRFAIVVAIAAVALLVACDFHKRRKYKGEAPPADDTAAKAVDTATPTNDTPPTETKPPAETNPPKTPPAETAEPIAAVEVPKGNGCDAVGATIANLQIAEFGANIPPEQLEQVRTMLTQAQGQITETCANEAWDKTKRACVLAAKSMQEFNVCIMPDPADHPECAAAVDNVIKLQLASMPEEQRAQLADAVAGRRLELINQCVKQAWPPEALQCLVAATAPEEMQACAQLMQPQPPQ